MVLGGAVIVLAASLIWAFQQEIPFSRTAGAFIVGLSIGAGWLGTYLVSQASFEVISVSSVTFTGPSADTLMGLVNERSLPLGFGSGLVPGVFVGALGMAILSKEARIQRFEPHMPMERYLLGGVLMGFGSMLAGGCAVGAGMSGGSIFALTAWVALFAMWGGAAMAHLALSNTRRAR